jgi:hypothetical protein
VVCQRLLLMLGRVRGIIVRVSEGRSIHSTCQNGDTGALAWAATQVWIVPTDCQHPLARLESSEGMKYLREGH